MSNFDRRQLLKALLGKLAQASGAVVVASTAIASVQGRKAEGAEVPATAAAETPPPNIQERADRLVASGNFSAEAAESNEFLNGAFRNTPLGAFRNSGLGGFRNTPIGAFRNGGLGGFRNTPLGGFGNGGWPNGGWGGFRNGGWPNGGWRNWW